MKLIPFIASVMCLLSLKNAIVVPGHHPSHVRRISKWHSPHKSHRRPQVSSGPQIRHHVGDRHLKTAKRSHHHHHRGRVAMDDNHHSYQQPLPGEGDGPHNDDPKSEENVEEMDEDFAIDNPYGENDVDQKDDPIEEEESEEQESEEEDPKKKKKVVPWYGAEHKVYEINFANLTENEHLENFKKISADLKLYEDEYKDCIKSIPDENYSQKRIDECVGPNFMKVMLDIRYETMRVISKADSRIKYFFLEKCYKKAGTNEEFARACDLFEADVLDLMWNGFDFIKLTELNKRKYTYDYAKLEMTIFKELLDYLEPIKDEFFELFNEIFAHKQVTLLRIKTLIDDRTKIIVAEARRDPTLVQPKIITHNVEIEQSVEGQNVQDYKDLPKQQIGGQDPSKFTVHDTSAFDRKLKHGHKKDIVNKDRLLNHGENYHGLHTYTRPPAVNRYQVVKRTNRNLSGRPGSRGSYASPNNVNVHGGKFMRQAFKKRGYK